MEKIIERVQKLLSLAGNNSNENEALAALEKAHALLAEHNLTMAEIELAGGNTKPTADEVRDSLHTDTNMPERYNAWIWNSVAEANSCLLFSNRPNKKKYRTIYTMVGRRVNTIIATQMALYLCQTMKRLCSEHCKTLAATPDFSYKNAYYVGMAQRLSQRVKEMKAIQGKGLVIWFGEENQKNREHVENVMGIKLKSRKVAKVRYDTVAMAKGRADAERVNLSQQVAGKAAPVAGIGV